MRTTLVMAHPDDEIIFGWPVLKQVSSILICSNDRNNPDRAWCRYRYKALEEVGELLGIPVISLDYDSEFYKLNARDGSLQRFIKDVQDNIDIYAQVIYTHNWFGEYGHMDHILVYYTMLQYVNRHPSVRLMTSDMHLQSEWMSFEGLPTVGEPALHGMTMCNNDLEFYEQVKAIYDKYGVWTWSKPPITKCNTHLI